MKPQDVLKDVSEDSASKVKIADIVGAFVKSKKPRQAVDFDAAGKKRDNMYASIRSYLVRNPEIKVTMSMQGGEIVLEQ